ncbi:uncharacterized protein TNCV_4349851 [Trichonephila clavipes]|nr:uncharacterized protein TNCV_4349851 [Trichonephila clavipes]
MAEELFASMRGMKCYWVRCVVWVESVLVSGSVVTVYRMVCQHQVGPSQSGKTSLVRKMIKNKIYDQDIKNIKWCYNYSSPWFLEEPGIDFVEGLPENYENVDLIVIDDLMHRLNEQISE